MNETCEDRFRGKRFAKYSVDEIEEYLKENPQEIDTKRGYELLVGCILARCSEQIEGELPVIGFMVKGAFSSTDQVLQPDLGKFIRGKLIEDQDFDILLQYDNSCSIVQITRLEEYRARNDATSGLMELIKKKLLVQFDDYLQLVVLVDHTFDLDIKQVNQSLKAESIPYKRIYIVAQVGTSPEPGKFSCLEVYPEICKSEVRLNIQ
jgi:hypothetical protein